MSLFVPIYINCEVDSCFIILSHRSFFLAEIDRAFKQFVFESMELASADSNGYIMTKMFEGAEYSAIPWDDPYPFFKGMIPKHQRPEKVIDLLNPYHSVTGLDELHTSGQSLTLYVFCYMI